MQARRGKVSRARRPAICSCMWHPWMYVALGFENLNVPKKAAISWAMCCSPLSFVTITITYSGITSSVSSDSMSSSSLPGITHRVTIRMMLPTSRGEDTFFAPRS